MPFAYKPATTPAGHRLIARGHVSKTGTVTNGINVTSATSPAQGKLSITLTSAAPAGAICVAMNQERVTIGGDPGRVSSGGVSGSTVSITSNTHAGALADCDVFFEVWAP